MKHAEGKLVYDLSGDDILNGLLIEGDNYYVCYTLK